ncbi:MAG: tyrosine--tRNA ligase [Candidatus Harrisonbacteria bacterium]|nr:tyrosine--tRNA ligase [Candidatus Harrisonbacteria bacterium]
MNDIEKLLSRGVEEVIERTHLENRLKNGNKLRVKFGIDPTAPDLHLGHTVPLRKLRQFQDAGHTAVLIIGDFTARVGDPTGKSEERKSLSADEVKANLKKYLRQAAKVLDIKFNWLGRPKKTPKFEIHYNSRWFAKDGIEKIMALAKIGTLNQMLQRAEFKKRIEEGGGVSMVESLYPLMQGYDSVMVKADVEIGGTDQKFNLLMGRQVQKHFGMPEQDVLTLPLLEGTDGVKKMSKSAGNYIALNAEPNDMFGKIMSVPDKLIDKYFILLTDRQRSSQNPREAKLELAETIVAMYYDEKAAKKAQAEFERVVSEGGKPNEIPVKKIANRKLKLSDLLVEVGMTQSKSEARRLIEQGGVKINDEKKLDPDETIEIKAETLIQVGRRHFLKVH